MIPKHTMTVLALWSLLLMSAPAWSITIAVPADEDTIQEGIDAAVDGDIVEVAAGTYFETLAISGKTIILRSEDGASATVIDGSDSGTVILVLNAPDTVIEGFSIVDGEELSGAGVWIESSDGTLVDDCVINGNDAVGAGDGGGMLIRSSTGVEIRDTTISSNTAVRDGGGIHASTSSLLIIDSTIDGNSADERGGGIFLSGDDGSETLVERSEISANSADEGAGAYADDALLVVSKSEVVWNVATTAGGGLVFDFGELGRVLESRVQHNTASDNNGGGIHASDLDELTVRSTLLTDNTAGNNGGGAFLSGLNDVSDPALAIALFQETTFSNNEAEEGGGAYVSDSVVEVVNTIFFGDAASLGDGDEITLSELGAETSLVATFSNLDTDLVDVLGGASLTTGLGMIDETPEFADPDDPFDPDYRETAASPTLDVGLDHPVVGDDDVDGLERTADGDGDGTAEVDMGAHECPFRPGDGDNDGLTTIGDALFVLAYLFQGGPAPVPLSRGDYNDDGSVSIVDPSFLLSYLFSGGAPPVCHP